MVKETERQMSKPTDNIDEYMLNLEYQYPELYIPFNITIMGIFIGTAIEKLRKEQEQRW
jgi:hypothetical protein